MQPSAPTSEEQRTALQAAGAAARILLGALPKSDADLHIQEKEALALKLRDAEHTIAAERDNHAASKRYEDVLAKARLMEERLEREKALRERIVGERLAEQMVTECNIEDAFKLYYLDNEGDTMLVSAHTQLRDLIYSELITAKLDELHLPEPAERRGRGYGGGGGRATQQIEEEVRCMHAQTTSAQHGIRVLRHRVIERCAGSGGIKGRHANQPHCCL